MVCNHVATLWQKSPEVPIIRRFKKVACDFMRTAILPYRDGVRSSAALRQSGLLPACVLSLLALLPGGSAAREPEFGRGYRQFTVLDGLPVNHITCLLQDSRGYLWVGTADGLARFDGVRFKTYSILEGLPVGFIASLAEDPITGEVWAGTINGGFARLRDDRFEQVGPRGDGLIAESARDGALWIVLSDSLYRLTDGALKFVAGGNPSVSEFTAIAACGDSTVAVLRKDSLCRYDRHGRLREAVRVPVRAPHRLVSLLCASDGTLWVGSGDSVLTAVRNGRVVQRTPIGAGMVGTLREDVIGRLWARTQLALVGGPPRLMVAGKGLTTRVEDRIPVPYWTGPMLVDRENVLWVGTYSRGLLRTNSLAVPDLVDSLGENPVVAGGWVWYTDRDGLRGAKFDEDNGWRSFYFPVPGLPGGRRGIHDCADPAGRIWAIPSPAYPRARSWRVRTAAGGAVALDPDVELDRPGLDQIWPSLVDTRGRLWYQTSGFKLAVVETKSGALVREFGPSDSLPAEPVRAIHEDRDGTVWVGMWGSGLRLARDAVDGRPLEVVTKADGLPDEGIRSLATDLQGRMWVGTRYGGAAVREGTHFRPIGMHEGLASNSIWQIHTADSDRVWLRTDRGFECVDAKSLTVLPNAIDFVGDRAWKLARQPSGLRPYLASPHIGLRVLDLGAAGFAAPAPPVYVTALSSDQRYVDPRRGLVLEHDNAGFTVDFAGIAMRDVGGPLYRWRLRGLETAWSFGSRERRVTYGRLPPGGYQFEVVAMAADGMTSRAPASTAITIREPFWQTWWFLSAVAVALAGGAVATWKRYDRRRRAEQRVEQKFAEQLLTMQEAERKRIAGELHDGIGQSLLIIKNQALLGIDGPVDPGATLEQLNGISDVASQAIRDLQEISHDLRPHLLDRLGLKRALEAMVARVAGSTHIRLSGDIGPCDRRFPEAEEIALYRIVQECLNNVVKHSGATEASVIVDVRREALLLVVRDDGRGMPRVTREAAPGGGGFGLKGIAERTRMLGGTLAVDSADGEGTTITITVPYVRTGSAA
jgi:signal transduction histidine kinase/ligand-binding sensor domain-containing protein